MSLSPLLGETVVEDTTMLQCNITGLTSVSSAWIETMCFLLRSMCLTILPECHLNMNFVRVSMLKLLPCPTLNHLLIQQINQTIICCVSVTPRTPKY